MGYLHNLIFISPQIIYEGKNYQIFDGETEGYDTTVTKIIAPAISIDIVIPYYS